LDFHAFSLAPAEHDHTQLHRNTTNNIEISSNRNDLQSQHRTPVEDQIKRDQLEQQNRDQEQSQLGWILLGSG
jgi:hypothetical protein